MTDQPQNTRFSNKRANLVKTGIVILCVLALVFSMWIITSHNASKTLPENTLVTAGDVVVVNIYAQSLEDVYAYQFNLNYDADKLDYQKHLYSDINDIPTIFAVVKGSYLLVGATMIGAREGFSGKNVSVCRVEFTALDDFYLETITISSVCTVSGTLQYLEDVDGWTTELSILS
ncbi:MAG: cohesin domain-containing protein [Coriobacteriia bacterium]|nr:cohesin domain-containing protein [Coriobacteriia bacterium]